MKTCAVCKNEKTESDFPLHHRTKDGLAKFCKSCQADMVKPGNRNVINDKTGYVYFVRAANGLVKIGVTTHLKSRIRLIELTSPIPVVTVAAIYTKKMRKAENVVHTAYRNFHSHGEWFLLDDTQLNKAISMIEDMVTEALLSPKPSK